jgi:hypothetical protein
VESDAARISVLMRISVLELFPRFYDEQQTASAAVHIAQLDMQLIHDGIARSRQRAGEGASDVPAERFDEARPRTGDPRLV